MTKGADYYREEFEVDQPLLTVDRQMGLVIVTPEGKVCCYFYTTHVLMQIEGSKNHLQKNVVR